MNILDIEETKSDNLFVRCFCYLVHNFRVQNYPFVTISDSVSIYLHINARLYHQLLRNSKCLLYSYFIFSRFTKMTACKMQYQIQQKKFSASTQKQKSLIAHSTKLWPPRNGKPRKSYKTCTQPCLTLCLSKLPIQYKHSILL